MIKLAHQKIGIPVEEVGKKINELNEILKEHNMVLRAENDVGVCFWKDENTAISQKYGDSAINPKKIFYKGDSTNSILIRLDDKIGRVMSNPDDKPRVNDVADIIGYCTLLLISMGVTAEDILKFRD